MKRLLLVGAALATLLLGAGSASAAETSVSCGRDLGLQVDPATRTGLKCTAADKLTVDGVPSLAIAASLGPIENWMIGDVQVVLESTTGRLELTCLYRLTSPGSGSCVGDEQGDWTDPVATCTGTGSGIGQFKVTCTNTTS